MLLTGVLAPSMGDFIIDAKMVKVKEDCEAIGIATMRLVRDIGPCLKMTADGTCIDVIYSQGISGRGNWPEFGGDMEEQFVMNQHAGIRIYPLPGWRGAYLSPQIGPDPWGTRYGVNSKFLVAPPAVHLVAATTAGANSCGNLMAGDPASSTCNGIDDNEADIICISGGPNQIYDSSFDGNVGGGTTRRGDDFVYVIQGSKRSFLD
jgi:hypothetical protein